MIIYGGTGTIGSELVKYAYQHQETFTKPLTVVSRDDTKQVKLWEELGRPDDVQFEIGDIRDREPYGRRDKVINLAAIKHVPWCEDNPKEAVKTNTLAVGGGFSNYTYVSSDKAVKPINVYGMTKAVGEKITLNNRGKVVRLGNITGSRGSVLPMAEKQAKKHGEVYLTHTDMKRYFIDVKDAARFIYDVSVNETEPGVYVPAGMKEKRIEPMLQKIADKHDANLEIIGKREGEKLEEDLVWPEESVRMKEIPE